MNYIYKVLLQFCLWCEIPLKLLKVYIINVQDCSSGPLFCSKTAKPSSLYKAMLFLLYLFDKIFNKYVPMSSQVSAPSYAPIVTSNKLLLDFIHVSYPLKSNDFLECFIISSSFLEILTNVFANVNASFSNFSLIEG